jgi:hypothetical protein
VSPPTRAPLPAAGISPYRRGASLN